MSVDYGTMNAFAALMWEKHGDTWYAVDEYYYSGRDKGVPKTDSEYAEDLEAFVRKYTGQRIETIIDPSAASFIAILQKKPNYKVRHANNDVMDGIRETATALKNGLIYISPKCDNWKKEASGYVWDDKSADDRPIKERDHLMDAMRYMVRTKRIAAPKRSKSNYFMYEGV